MARARHIPGGLYVESGVARHTSGGLWVEQAAGGGATILPSGTSWGAIGTSSIAYDLFVTPSAKNSDSAFGSFSVQAGDIFVLPNSKGSDEAYGTVVLLSGQSLITLTGKASDEAFGAFAVITGDQIIYVAGKDTDEAFGTPSFGPFTVIANGLASGEAIGAVTLLYSFDQTITLTGQEYLEIGSFILSGTAVYRTKHFFDWVASQSGLTGSINDKLYQYLVAQGFTGSVPSMMFIWLRSLGYTGNTASMIRQFEDDNTVRWH